MIIWIKSSVFGCGFCTLPDREEALITGENRSHPISYSRPIVYRGPVLFAGVAIEFDLLSLKHEVK